tara:strand:+ start:2080 stop:2625 length:546 start_codon:yes stop_codon:yes gene_type:complete
MSNYEATRYNFTGADLTGIEGIPTATIVEWSSASVPTGFLECDGSAVSRSTYSALFAIVGTTYGSGDGASTFNLPNLSDKVAVGKSNNKALASTGGAETVTSTGNVANTTLSTSQIPSHNHPAAQPTSGGEQEHTGNPSSPLAQSSSTGSTGGGGSHSHNFSGDATSVLQPFLTVIYIIKT